jgi:SprT protein
VFLALNSNSKVLSLVSKVSLINHFPNSSHQAITKLLEVDDLKVFMVKSRSTKLGDFRFGKHLKHKVITVNENLDSDISLFIFLHEYAHYLTHNACGGKLGQPHGNLWKQYFSDLLHQFVRIDAFSPEITPLVLQHANRPRATLNADADLYAYYRSKQEQHGDVGLLIESIAFGELFEYRGRKFLKKHKNRSRYTCYCLSNKRTYTFHPKTPIECLES